MITSSSLPLPLGIQLIFRCIIMEAHGNIEAAAATEHGSESQLIELLSEDAGQTGEYELPLESDAVEPPSKKVKLTLTTSAAAEHASPDRTATEHASPDGTATEHASTSANAKGCASADDTPLETVSLEPDSSCSMGLPFPLHHLGAVVKKHADNYKPEGSPDIYFQGEPFKLKDIRDDYMHQRRSCDQGILYACIKALLIVYHVDKFEHTATMKECVSKKVRGKAIYDMFHIDATASVYQFARKHKLSQGNVVTLLTAGLYADLHPNRTKELPASPKSLQPIRRAERYLHRLGECIHPEERNAPLHVDT